MTTATTNEPGLEHATPTRETEERRDDTAHAWHWANEHTSPTSVFLLLLMPVAIAATVGVLAWLTTYLQ